MRVHTSAREEQQAKEGEVAHVRRRLLVALRLLRLVHETTCGTTCTTHVLRLARLLGKLLVTSTDIAFGRLRESDGAPFETLCMWR